MATKPSVPNEKWFCVEDCAQANKPVLLLSAASLQECHDFIERCREHQRPGQYRVNYSPAMRRYLQATISDAA